MRMLPIIFVVLAGSLAASEPAPAYPLWDGVESVADYAKKVNLQPTKTLDLGNGVKLELVLIPAGKFIMGTPEPIPVDEEGFHKKIMIGQVLFAVSAVFLLAMLCVIVAVSIRKRQKPKYSLLWLLLMTIMAGIAILSGLHWRLSDRALEKATQEYLASKSRFDIADRWEKPAHTVTVTKPFFMGKFVVTQEQYQQVTGNNPSHFKGKDNPVEWVTWDDAQAFCKKLSGQTKFSVRLPTEAEWEFSCRAGTSSVYYSGDTEADVGRVAWYHKNTTHPVGQKEPNAFGLYDMHGNVWQWCEDWFREDYYGNSPAEDPNGPAKGPERVMRGGSRNYGPVYCRSAARYRRYPENSYSYFGFRVVVVPAFRTP